MKNFKIMIIDDEFSDMRKKIYMDFLTTEYSGVEVCFDVEFIEYARDVSQRIKEKIKYIDAFFIDARLDTSEKGWINDGYGMDFNSVLSIIEEACKDLVIPPIFMISKHWTDQDLLTMVSKSFSVFHTSVQPSRFFSLEGIENWTTRANEKSADGSLDFKPLKEEREYIYHTIKKVRKNIAGLPVDIVLILAVPDEKEMAFKVFGVTNKTLEYNSKYGLYYNLATVGEYRIAIILQTEMGMANASIVATSSILAFNPSLVAMTGICAGKEEETRLYDIIIPKEAFDYSCGKMNVDDKEFRPSHEPLDRSILAMVTHSCDKKLLADIRTGFEYGEIPDKDIKVHIEAMATGTFVVDDPSVFDEIKKRISGKCIALDMEAYAVALSARTFNKKWVVIKSVQDYANGKKSEDEKKARNFAAYSSAKLLYDLIPGIMETISN